MQRDWLPTVSAGFFRFQSCAPPTSQVGLSLLLLLLKYQRGPEHKATRRVCVILRAHAWRPLCARFSGRVTRSASLPGESCCWGRRGREVGNLGARGRTGVAAKSL